MQTKHRIKSLLKAERNSDWSTILLDLLALFHKLEQLRRTSNVFCKFSNARAAQVLGQKNIITNSATVAVVFRSLLALLAFSLLSQGCVKIIQCLNHDFLTCLFDQFLFTDLFICLAHTLHAFVSSKSPGQSTNSCA